MSHYLKLKCKDKPFRNQTWKLYLTADNITLLDNVGHVIIKFSRKDAEKKLILPNFMESIANIGVKLNNEEGVKLTNKEIRWFAPEKKSVQMIRDYLDKTTVKQGKKAVEALKKNGYEKVYGGLSLFILGIIFCGIIINMYKDVESGIPRPIMYLGGAPTVYGLLEFFRGVSSIKKYQRIQRTRSMF